jgi:putative oxidoreductase
MSFFSNRWFLLLLRVVLGGVFVYAGALKIANPLNFADSIATFQVLPMEFIGLVALGLPPFEILVGGCLILGIFQRQAAFALLGLVATFALFLIQAIIRGLEVDCGCFGSGQPSAWSAWISLGRNVPLALGCWWIYRIARPGICHKKVVVCFAQTQFDATGNVPNP